MEVKEILDNMITYLRSGSTTVSQEIQNIIREVLIKCVAPHFMLAGILLITGIFIMRINTTFFISPIYLGVVAYICFILFVVQIYKGVLILYTPRLTILKETSVLYDKVTDKIIGKVKK